AGALSLGRRFSPHATPRAEVAALVQATAYAPCVAGCPHRRNRTSMLALVVVTCRLFGPPGLLSGRLLLALDARLVMPKSAMSSSIVPSMRPLSVLNSMAVPAAIDLTAMWLFVVLRASSAKLETSCAVTAPPVVCAVTEAAWTS